MKSMAPNEKAEKSSAHGRQEKAKSSFKRML